MPKVLAQKLRRARPKLKKNLLTRKKIRNLTPLQGLEALFKALLRNSRRSKFSLFNKRELKSPNNKNPWFKLNLLGTVFLWPRRKLTKSSKSMPRSWTSTSTGKTSSTLSSPNSPKSTKSQRALT